MSLQQCESAYSVTISFFSNNDTIAFEIVSADFTPPTEEDIQEINTSKQLVYLLSEIFGDTIYEYVECDIVDAIEEIEINEIADVQICDKSNDVTYYLNLQRKIVEIE
jgi:hypothetical protein